MKRITLALMGLSLSAVTFGCADPGVAPPPVEREESPIISGQLSTPEDDAVVSMRGVKNNCTGTLISPHVMLTALHCAVSDYDSNISFRCNPDGTLAAGSSGGKFGPLLKPQNVTVRAGVQTSTLDPYVTAKALYSTGSDTACHDDFAVIVLNDVLDIGDAPYVSLRFHATTAGEVTRTVGYGDTMGTSAAKGRQERRNMPILGVGASDASSDDGDPGVLPHTVQTGEGPCFGDSGGPLFSQASGAQIGLYSILLSNSCVGSDVTNAYTEIARFESLIREAMATVGEEPIVEPPPATGTGGDAGAPGQGGEPGSAGNPGEAGASAETGGTGATGGSGGSGDSSSVGGTSTGGTGGSDAATGGDGAMTSTPRGTGSGSRRDSSCAVRAGTTPEAGSRSARLLSLLALTFAFRRRRSLSR